ncbi:MAG: RIP metalloprotease RseP [Candidatus Midichloria sp.]|nr:MAG: RIP metalloprotease RseP [Candidatus Midichloria sp.]
MWFIIVISIVVFVHEFGHFYFARYYGIEVQKFSLGFGPALFKYRDKKDTEWTLSAIPLGGYVKLYGDDADPSFVDPERILNISKEEQNKSFYCKSLKQKALIVFAGPLANYILSFLCFAVVFMMIGVPTLDLKVNFVQEHSVASAIGLKQNDVIVEIDNQRITNGEEFKSILNSGEEEVYLKFLRDNQEFSTQFKLPFEKNGTRIFGVVFETKIENASIIKALMNSAKHVYFMSKAMLLGMVDMVRGDIGIENIGGPIKIAEYSSKAASQSFDSLIWFIALVSLNLGLVNLLPIPMLDGGRLLFYFIEAINGKPLNKSTKVVALRIGFIILIMLMLVAISNDVVSLL